MPKFKEVLFGKSDKTKQLATQSREQKEISSLINKGLQTGRGPLGDIFGGFDKKAFKRGVTEPALKNFEKYILPMLQEKFISGNQVGGSGMRNEFSKAGEDLQAQLAGLMYQAQQGQQQNRLQGINTLLGTKPFENIYKQGNQGLVQGTIQGFAEGAGKAAGSFIAG